jgi:hypothetical protein
MEQNVTNNALRFIGEMFLPGASQYVSGNIGSGVVHSLLAGAAGAALISSGVAPVIGTLAVVGVKLNSFASAASGRSLLDHGTEAVQRASNRFGSTRTTTETTPVTSTGPTTS